MNTKPLVTFPPKGIQAPSMIEVVISAIPSPVFFKDNEGRYLGCNEAFEEFVGRTKDELIGKTVFELWEKELAEIYHEADQALLEAGGEQIYEALVNYADGTKRNVMFHKANFYTEQDDVFGMVGVMLDITDRKELEQSLKHSNELFEMAFRSNPGLLMITEPETGTFHDVNDSWLETLKYERSAVIGKTVFDIGLWPDLKERTKLLEELSNGNLARDHEVKLKAKDGTIVFCQISGQKVKTNDSKLVLWTANNITKRVEAEEANEAKSVFLSNMTHEFRTPLNSILGFSQMLQMNRDQNLTEKQLDWLDQIYSSGSLMLNLVNDVLDLARIESGKIEYLPDRFNPQEILNECCDVVKPLLKDKNITLQCVAETQNFVHVDRGKLKQVLLNLMNNAVKYNTQNGIVRFGCKEKTDNLIELFVEDTGVGIPEEDIPLIFDPFHRSKDQMHHEEGTGVGLSIVKKYTELMGGTISVESSLGKGSHFKITLPLS